jgi:hypothetical protein
VKCVLFIANGNTEMAIHNATVGVQAKPDFENPVAPGFIYTVKPVTVIEVSIALARFRYWQCGLVNTIVVEAGDHSYTSTRTWLD